MDLLDDNVEGGSFGYSETVGKSGHKKKKMVLYCCLLCLVLLAVVLFMQLKCMRMLQGEGFSDSGVVPIYDQKVQFAARQSAVGTQGREESWGIPRESFIVDTPIMEKRKTTMELGHELMMGN